MKVLFLLNTNRFSGAENVACQIISMFKDDDEYDMAYCSPNGEISGALEERGIAFIPIKEMNVFELKRVIEEFNPDIIHAHDMRASFIAALTCGRRRLISHIHNNSYDSRKISLKSVGYIYAAVKAEHIYWVSQSAYEEYRFSRFFKSKSQVLYNVINIDDLYNKMLTDDKEYDFDVVFLGSLIYPKNPERLIDVMAKIKKERPTVKCAIVGEGDMLNDVKERASLLGVEENITFFGYQSNPLKIVYSSKIMLMTSRWEGTPMCALEAMSLGVPIVSTPVDGLKDLVINDENGFVSNEDSELSKKICMLLDNHELLHEMSQKQLEKARKINDIEAYKRAIRKAYDQQ